jgi:predicted Zn-dependent peptidase
MVTPYEPAQAAQVVFVRPHLKQQTLLLSLPMIATDDPDYHAAHLAASILGHVQGSRFYWNLYHKGLAQSANSRLWTFQGTGMLILEALTTPDNAPQVLTLMRTELANLLAHGIIEEELFRAKNKRTSAMVFSCESPSNRMYWLATDWMFLGRLSQVEEDIAQIEQVTSEGVMRVLHRFPLLDK